MDYLSHIIYGAIIAFVGMVPPGMLNMTALKIRMERGRPQSVKYAFGATAIIFFQAVVAVVFAIAPILNDLPIPMVTYAVPVNQMKEFKKSYLNNAG